MEDFNFHWLVFKYDFKKLDEIRKDFANHDDLITFKYTCASVKTFLRHNPGREKNISIWTDDFFLVQKVFAENGIKTDKIKIFDISREIELDKQNPYPWYVKSAFLVRHFKENSLFIDNDCICKKNIDSLLSKLDDKKIILWEFERVISNSRPYWGWQMATEHLRRPLSYWIANDGIIGLTKKNLDQEIMKRSSNMCMDIYHNVDISSRFPDRHPKLMISQQMAMCYAAQDIGLQLVESKEYFDHHYSDKKKCLEYL